MEKHKIIGTVIGVLAFIALVAGLTYAWFTWQSGNTILNGTTECFRINYVNGQNISGEITPSSDYTGGKTTTVEIGIDPSCAVGGTGTIKLTTEESTTMNLDDGAVKYAVYNGASEVSSGSVTSGTIDLAPVELTTSQVTYTVYIWVDGEITDNTYVGTSYSGYIHATAEQAHE